MKEIELLFLSSVLKSILSTLGISTFQTGKENEGVEKQKADIETIQHITKIKKSKQTWDGSSQNEEYANKIER